MVVQLMFVPCGMTAWHCMVITSPSSEMVILTLAERILARVTVTSSEWGRVGARSNITEGPAQDRIRVAVQPEAAFSVSGLSVRIDPDCNVRNAVGLLTE